MQQHATSKHARAAAPIRLLQESVQLLLDTRERILAHVIDVPLLPVSPFLFGTQRLDLLFDGDLENRHGQVHLGKTRRQEMASGVTRT